MKLKKLFLLLFLCSGVLYANPSTELNYKGTEGRITSQNQNDYQIHIVAKGETVYSIAGSYGLSTEDIYRLNPDSRNTIKEGDMLRLPQMKIIEYIDHRIEAKQTLFGISREYSIKVEDIRNANPGLDEKSFKAGKDIKIPVFGKIERKKAEHIVEKRVTEERNDSAEKISYNANDKIVRVGVLLPFLDDNSSIQKEKIAEYYEGLLLAVRELKKKGLNAEIYTFDIGKEDNTKRLERLYETTELKSLDFIIGGVSKNHITSLSTFSKKENIKYIIPFGTQNTDMKSNPNTFQVVNSHSNLYGKISSNFVSRYKNHNIIIVEENGSDNSKLDFIAELKKNLTSANITFKSVTPSSSLTNELNKTLDKSRKNILIPTSSSEATLRRLFVVIKSLDQYSISLFGYPEWQAYVNLIPSLHQYNSSIFCSFYAGENQKSVKQFVEEYSNWYNKNLIHSYPKFGLLGYDTGIYFLTGINKYGDNLITNISSLKVPTLQSAMRFEQENGQPGHVNNGVYFINFGADNKIEKMECTN